MNNRKNRRNLTGVLVVGVILIFFVISIFLLLFETSGRTPGTLVGGDKIGVVEVEGIILRSKQIIEDLEKYRKDDSIKAVVLRVDSPGGAIGPTQEIYEEVKKVKEEKKIVASMGSVAASGGYYISCVADRVFANPGSITGSIGVIMQFSHIEEILDRFKWKHEVIKSGPQKDVGSPFRRPTERDMDMLQDVINNVYDQFIRHVSEGRGLPIEDVKKIADGRILSGEMALEFGLVDALGSLRDAIEWVSGEVGIEDEPHVVYPKKKKDSFLDYLIGEDLKLSFRRLIEGGFFFGPYLHFK